MYEVLLIDDEIKIIEWLSRSIPWESLGFHVCELCTGSLQALNYMEHHPVDVVITDIRMPGLNGLALIQKLHQFKPDIQTIILSGYNQFEYAQQAIRYGVRGFLLKPLDPDELIDLLQNIAKEPGKNSPSPSFETISLFSEPSGSRENRMNEILEYIDKNYNKDLCLKGCADVFGLHPAYLGKIFKDAAGMPFNTYLNKKRIAKLKKLLVQSSLPVNQLLESVGFHNYEYFYTVFKKHEGISFSEYRSKSVKLPPSGQSHEPSPNKDSISDRSRN